MENDSDKPNNNPDSLLGYPGKVILESLMNSLSLTCYFYTFIVLTIINITFLPIDKMWGKALIDEYPWIVVWNIVVYVLLGFLSEKIIKKTLKNSTHESWSVPGKFDITIPLQVEMAVSNVPVFWLVFLSPAVMIHHNLLPWENGAIIESPWIKAIVVFLSFLIFRTLLLARARYELLK